MATNIQSQPQTELKCYLEECLHMHCPAASNQEIAQAVDAALGRCGYLMDLSRDQRGQPNREMRDNSSLSMACSSIASVRDAAIAAAQCLSDSSLRMAAIACACASYAATCALAEQMNQNEQQAACN